MGESFLILLVASIFFLLWGISSLRSDQVYWGRLLNYWGRLTVTKGRIPARIHGFPVTAGGAMGLLTLILDIFGADSAVVKTLITVCGIFTLAGVIGSIVASRLGFGEEEQHPLWREQATRKNDGDWYGRL